MKMSKDRFLADKVVDARLNNVIISMHKDAVEKSKSTGKPIPSLSIILAKHGVFTPEESTRYLNKMPDNKQDFQLIPTDYKPVDLSQFNLSNVDRLKLASVCFDNSICPYEVIGDGIVWAVKEYDTDEDRDKYYSLANTLGFSILGKSQGFAQNTLKDFVDPLFDVIFHDFCRSNDLPDYTEYMYMPSPQLMANFYIVKGIILNASDIFFDPKYNGIRVSYSIYNDWILDDMVYLSPERTTSFIDQIESLAKENTMERSTKGPVLDLSIKNLGDVGNKYNGRVNALRINEVHDAICIRVVDKSKKMIPFTELKLTDDRKAVIEKIAHNNNGLIILGGSTGAGKTTTALSIIGLFRIIFPYKRIETSELPVEQTIEEISQIDLERADLTFEVVSEAETRRNAPIQYVGEFNSERTVRFGVDAAIKNTLIFTTTHSMDAAIIPDRIRSLTWKDPNLFVQFLQVLRGIIHQAMLKEVCPNCSELVSIKDDDRITVDMQNVLKYYRYYNDKILMIKPLRDKNSTGPTERYRDCNCPICLGRGFQITKPIIVSEVFPIDDYTRYKLTSIDPSEIYFYIYERMRKDGNTEIQDALGYMKKGKVDWMQIWDRLGLCNKVSSALFDDDEKFQKTMADNIKFHDGDVGSNFHNYR